MATVPFAFLPRVVSKHAKPWQGISSFSPTPSPSPDLTTDSEPDDDDEHEPSSCDKGKGKEKAVESAHSKQSNITQDIASLISLALSDYNIWRDADLRCKLDACLSDETCPDGAGFVPINYILRRAPFRGALPRIGSAQPEPSETEVVKALRTHASHLFEVRMRLPSSSSVWYGTGKTSRKKDVGGYEVRRKDWACLRDRPSRGWMRPRWDDMTTYMEGIPPQYRTIGGIASFVETLLSPETDSEPPFVQNVILPPHYLDKPGDTPKCKGYALITLSTKSHAEALRRTWPWKRVPAHEDGSQIVKEAHKYGLRTISKARWDALNEEYLIYKQSLVDAIPHAHTEMDDHPSQGATETRAQVQVQVQAQDEQPRRSDESRTRRRTTPTSPYPFDCLVFVRNVHPDTNKTTLKAFFGQAFQHAPPPPQLQPQLSGAGLDYVDFNKGMDTCYLRLASQHHATRLIAYFAARDLAQADGLDATGCTPVQNSKPITVEMVQGKKEELYWEKVPEKVRRQAVDKAVKVGGGESESSSTIHMATNATHGSESGRRKRRREP